MDVFLLFPPSDLHAAVVQLRPVALPLTLLLTPHDLCPLPPRFLMNYEKLKSRLGEIYDSKVHLEQDLRTQVQDYRETDRRINSLRPDLIELRNIRDEYLKYITILLFYSILLKSLLMKSSFFQTLGTDIHFLSLCFSVG